MKKEGKKKLPSCNQMLLEILLSTCYIKDTKRESHRNGLPLTMIYLTYVKPSLFTVVAAIFVSP